MRGPLGADPFGYDMVVTVPPLPPQHVDVALEQLVADAVVMAMPLIEQKIDETASALQWRLIAAAIVIVGGCWAVQQYGRRT